jgi:hypothetical protein
MSTEIDQLRIESSLTEQFRVFTYPDGSRIVAANGYVMDYPMFCCMLIWMLSGSVFYINVLSKNDRAISRIKELNQNVPSIQSLEGYSLSKHVFNMTGRMLVNNSKQELMELMSAHLKQNKLLT